MPLRRRASADVVDLLASLNPERICALYYALPRERRASILKHGDWACCVNRTNEDNMQQSLIDIEDFIEDFPTTELSRAIAVADLGREFEVPTSLRVVA